MPVKKIAAFPRETTMKKRAGNGTLVTFVSAALFALLAASSFMFIDQASGGQSFVNRLGMEFVQVPAGSFIMGSPASEKRRDLDEKPHKVIISRPFLIQTTEVTVAQWKSVMGRRMMGASKGGNLPVTRVSWNDCVRFIDRLNSMGDGKYRLPTEAEWEYACRAGSNAAFFWGDEIDSSKALYANNMQGANDCAQKVAGMGISASSPAPVKSFSPNAWGIYDMHGNLWEWCSDWYGAYPEGEAVDPQGPAIGSRRVRRGGSWFKYGHLCRSANRNFAHPASRYSTVGLRLVKITD